MKRIEISPLFRIAQENDQKLINPLVRIFKATDDKVTEHLYVPLNPKHTDTKRYERIEIDKNSLNSTSKIMFAKPFIVPYPALSPQLPRFEYAYSSAN